MRTYKKQKQKKQQLNLLSKQRKAASQTVNKGRELDFIFIFLVVFG